MKKNTKILFLSSAIVILIAAMVSAGNYFFNYAIKRRERVIHKKPLGKSIYADSFDGLKIHAYESTPKETSNKWAILVHGYTQNSSAMASRAKKFVEKGFNVLTPDCRGHGKSEGAYIGMGWHDRLDVISWINEIIKRDENAEIVLYGVSMGGATVMMVSGENLPQNVKCIIQDCGYTSIYEIFKHQLKSKFGLPAFPLMYVVDLVFRLRAGYGFLRQQGSAIKQIQNTNLPILFIHGDKDDFVPTSMVFELYEQAGGEKEILVIKGADHGQCYHKNKKLYLDTMWRFVDKYIQ